MMSCVYNLWQLSMEYGSQDESHIITLRGNTLILYCQIMTIRMKSGCVQHVAAIYGRQGGSHMITLSTGSVPSASSNDRS